MKRTNPIASLFQVCTDLRLSFNALERQAAMVQEISMNASVTAAQTGSHIKTCSEIANQIALTGRRMRTHIDDLRAEVNQIIHHALTELIQENRLGKYQEALQGVQGDRNRQLVHGVIERYIEGLFAASIAIQKHVHQSMAILRGLSQCQCRLFAAQSALEIEAVDFAGAERQAVTGLVEKLNATNDESADLIRHTAKVLASIMRLTASVQRVTRKELARAKICAA